MKKLEIIKRTRAFFMEVRAELKKVTWPTRPDVQKTTIAVLVLSIIFGIYLQVIDFSFRYVVERIIGLFR